MTSLAFSIFPFSKFKNASHQNRSEMARMFLQADTTKV